MASGGWDERRKIRCKNWLAGEIGRVWSRPVSSKRSSAMSQHPSLKKSKSVGSKRSVLKRFERVKLMQARGLWKDGRSPMGLPKTKPAE